MKKRVISIICGICIVCTFFAGCAKKSGDHGDFYPYNLSKFIRLGDYWDIDYKPMDTKVTNEDVDKKIKSELERLNLTTTKTKDDEIVNGDTANIDYKGFANGHQFEGGTDEGYSLKIGSNTFIPGFEDGLVGKKAGEEVRIELTFPEEYHSKELAGKDAVFIVKINSVTYPVYPDLTDEIVSKISNKKTITDYKKYIYDNLVVEKTEQAANENKENLIEAVLENCVITKYPKKEVNVYKNNLTKQYEEIAGNNGLTLEAYVGYNGYSLDSFDNLMEDNARNLVAKEMVFLMIADKEGIKIDEKEYQAGIERYMEENRYTSKQLFLENIGEDKLKGLLVIDKTVDYMLNKLKNR